MAQTGSMEGIPAATALQPKTAGQSENGDNTAFGALVAGETEAYEKSSSDISDSHNTNEPVHDPNLKPALRYPGGKVLQWSPSELAASLSNQAGTDGAEPKVSNQSDLSTAVPLTEKTSYTIPASIPASLQSQHGLTVSNPNSGSEVAGPSKGSASGLLLQSPTAEKWEGQGAVVGSATGNLATGNSEAGNSATAGSEEYRSLSFVERQWMRAAVIRNQNNPGHLHATGMAAEEVSVDVLTKSEPRMISTGVQSSGHTYGSYFNGNQVTGAGQIVSSFNRLRLALDKLNGNQEYKASEPTGLASWGSVSPQEPGSNNIKSMSLTISSPIQSHAWANDLGGRLTWMVGNNVRQADIHLNPQNMGPMKVSVSVGADQTVNIQMVVTHASTKEAVDAALPRLREMFEQQGLNLGNVDITDNHSHKNYQKRQEQQPYGESSNDSLFESEHDKSVKSMEEGFGGDGVISRASGLVDFYV